MKKLLAALTATTIALGGISPAIASAEEDSRITIQKDDAGTTIKHKIEEHFEIKDAALSTYEKFDWNDVNAVEIRHEGNEDHLSFTFHHEPLLRVTLFGHAGVLHDVYAVL